MIIQGVYPPIATPFDGQGDLDVDALRFNVGKWDETGLNGYVVAGSNGESVLLTDQEIAQAVGIVRETAAEDKLVIAGVGRQSTRATLGLVREAAAAGAQVALVMNPFFYGGQMTAEALVRHYHTLADAAPIPVMVYNVPKYTHSNMDAAMVAHIAEHDNIVGVKDSAGNIAQLIDLVRLCPPRFNILVGNGAAFLSGVEAGASGGILALANVAPRECVRILEMARAGQHEQARQIHHRVVPVNKAVTATYGVPGLKAALDLLGYKGRNPRPPLMPLNDQNKKNVRSILTEAALL